MNSKNDKGITSIEMLAAMFVILAVISVYYFNTNHSNLQSQLQFAKDRALQQAQITGGLTPGIVQNVKDTLSRANADPNQIIVTSPQTTPVPYGGDIQIDIIITSNPIGGIDENGIPSQERTTLHAQGTVVSQYSE